MLSTIQSSCGQHKYKLQKTNNLVPNSGTLAVLRSIGSNEIDISMRERNDGPVFATIESNGSVIGLISTAFSRNTSEMSSTRATALSTQNLSSFSSGASSKISSGLKGLPFRKAQSGDAFCHNPNGPDEDLGLVASPITLKSQETGFWCDISSRRETVAESSNGFVSNRHRENVVSSTYQEDVKSCGKRFSASEAVELGVRVQRILDLEEDNCLLNSNSQAQRSTVCDRTPNELEKTANNLSIGEQIAQYRALRQLHKYEVSEANEVDAFLLSENEQCSSLGGYGAVAMCTEYCELIEQCWSQNPADRPNADELVWRLISMINTGIQGDDENTEDMS
eukprot:IDg10902t1